MGAAQSLVVGTPSLENFARNTLTGKLRELGQLDGKSEQFYAKILDIFATINSSMPGVRYDVPGRDKIQNLSKEWNNAKDEDAKLKLLSDLFTENPVSKVTIVTGIVAPPAMMLTKRVLENLPKINVISFVPDAVFVPITSVASLALARFCTKMIRG